MGRTGGQTSLFDDGGAERGSDAGREHGGLLTRPLPPQELLALRAALLSWYDSHARALPWRATRDPYAIWLSEIMLQQTTVAAVAPRWRRFLERFPTLAALASAPQEEVLAEWTGLGYYARARNLYAAAQTIVAQHGGAVPKTYQELRHLRGMGAYTAAAVASIAHGEPVAAVDANVERVLARIDAEPEDVKQTATRKRLAARAAELLDPDRPGDWNQAVMELGATVCLPRGPLCGICPVAPWCLARASGRPEAFPVKAKRPPMEQTREVAVALRRMEKVLILRRREDVSFGGMWELPRVVLTEGEDPRAAAVRAAQEMTGLAARPGKAPLLRLRHVVMRRRIELEVFTADYAMAPVRLSPLHTAYKWVLPEEWATHPVSVTQQDIARFLAENVAPRRAVKRKAAEEDFFGETME